MPIRPRSHQLEDISISAFLALMPPAWAARRKEKDYGVDLEVEIFETDGRSTGLIFLVQVRATDGIKRANRLSLKIAQIEYFRVLDLPTLLARYCHETGDWRTEWAFNLGFGLPENQKSFTHVLNGVSSWVSESPARIRRTLEVLRAIKISAPTARLGIRLHASTLPPAERYVIEAAVDDMIRLGADVLISPAEESRILALDVRAEATLIRVELDCIGSATMHLEGWDRSDLCRRLLYAIILIGCQHEFNRVAGSLAAAALAAAIRPIGRVVALKAAVSLAPSLEAAAQLAILGELHAEHDGPYASFLEFLLRLPAPEDVRRRAMATFYAAAIASARPISTEREGAVRYSLANFLLSLGEYREALSEYNRARHLRPAYMTSDYFLHEIGSCLFNNRRFRCARVAYQSAIDAGFDDHRARLHLADATLFSGRASDALEQYNRVADGADVLVSHEARIKAGLCEWLMELVNAKELPLHREEALRLHEIGEIDLPDIVTRFDALNETAHFNLGVSQARAGAWDCAVGHFLVAAVRRSGDLDAWANALIAAWNIGEVGFIIAIMSTALSLAGRAAYDRLREILVEQDAPTQMIDGLDEVCRQLVTEVRNVRARDLTLRVLGEAHYDVTVVNPS